MNRKDTYIVINDINKVKQISHFKLDLGFKLLNDSQQLMPKDIIIQRHLLFFDEYIYSVGHIGSLYIYTSNKLNINEIMICNNRIKKVYTLSDDISVYDNINKMLSDFFDNNKIKSDISTKEEVEVKQDINLSNKKISEMTEEERILYARTRFN